VTIRPPAICFVFPAARGCWIYLTLKSPGASIATARQAGPHWGRHDAADDSFEPLMVTTAIKRSCEECSTEFTETPRVVFVFCPRSSLTPTTPRQTPDMFDSHPSDVGPFVNPVRSDPRHPETPPRDTRVARYRFRNTESICDDCFFQAPLPGCGHPEISWTYSHS
jgi:hypothetical protein